MIRSFLTAFALVICSIQSEAADPVKVTNWDGYVELQESTNVWVVYFYNATGCSKCDTFATQWTDLASSMGSFVKLAELNMDTEDAKDVAWKTGGMEMETGIPHVRLLYSKHDYVSLMDGTLLASDLILGKIKSELENYEKDSSGYFLKQSPQEDL